MSLVLPPRFAALALCMALIALLLSQSPTSPAPAPLSRRYQTLQELFRDEIQQAATNLKWHGEPLTENTVYAAALTGASWESAWNKDHLFWLGWGDARGSRKRRGDADKTTISEIRNSYSDRDYQRVVNIAMAHCSPEEIASNVDLKEEVGISFLELGQPERAFPIFAAPYKAQMSSINLADVNRLFRAGAFDAAQRAGLRKEAIAFALSLLLEPGTEWPGVNTNALRYLEQEGVDVDRVLFGIMEAPPRLRSLSAYTYAAADLLVVRATPRMLPLFLELAGGDDVYLRGRALLGLGVIAFRSRPEDPGNRQARRIIDSNFHEYGISAGQRGMIDKAILDAVHDGRYRLRAAAALALGLTGADESLPLLRRLAQDKAYVLSPPVGRDHTQHIVFPVRLAAVAALARYGVAVDPDGGDLSGRALDRARRGGQDVTHDRAGLSHDMVSAIAVSPTDVTLPTLPLQRPETESD